MIQLHKDSVLRRGGLESNTVIILRKYIKPKATDAALFTPSALDLCLVSCVFPSASVLMSPGRLRKNWLPVVSMGLGDVVAWWFICWTADPKVESLNPGPGKLLMGT